jgi:hypothetical protein
MKENHQSPGTSVVRRRCPDDEHDETLSSSGEEEGQRPRAHSE